MARIMSIESAGGRVEAGRLSGVRLLAGLRGSGLPPVALQWFEGAGDGATLRGGRNLSRVMDLRLQVYGTGRAEVNEAMSLIGRIFALGAGPVRLRFELDGEAWYTLVARTGGGDWEWGADSDGSTFIHTTITVQAGDPYWTRELQEQRSIVPGGLGRGLIKDTTLSKLQVSTTTAFGSVDFNNTGDVPAYGIWTITAPFSGFQLVSQSGEALVWTGEKPTGHLVVDTELGTVTDELGANRYAGFASAPRFWAIPAGASAATVVADDAAAPGTTIRVVWNVKKWIMF